MPGWAGSSWYWFRYMDPTNAREFVGKEAEAYWKDVDLYIGGSEHATGHLLYSRFWCKALKDLGYVHAEEPFKKLINQGHIQGVSKFVYRLTLTFNQASGSSDNLLPEVFVSKDCDLGLARKKFEIELEAYNTKYGTDFSVPYFRLDSIQSINVDISLVEDDKLNIDGFRKWRPAYERAIIITDGNGQYACGSEVEKLSKSKYNVVNPDDVVSHYGADTLRLYEMFLGPLEQSKPWSTHGIDGVSKFLRKFWNLFHDANGNFKVSADQPSKEEYKALHKTIRKIEEDIEAFSFNTSASEFMICVNSLQGLKCNKRAILEPLTIVLSPFAPHITEELWEKLGHNESILKATYPKFEEKYLVETSFEYPVSINGKVRAKMNFALDMPKEDMEKLILASEEVQKWTEGKVPKKVIIVQGRMVNVVI
jgi:leucyl-tRNA synthetase